MKLRKKYVKFGSEFFNINKKGLPKGTWWYWFCLFFFDNPDNPKKPRQVMITWSSKNERELDINSLRLKGYSPREGGTLDGAIASWYFDGRKMHHNYLLEHCSINVIKRTLRSCSTFFKADDKMSRIRIGDAFDFVVEPTGRHDTAYYISNITRSKGYSNVEAKHFRLGGKVNGEAISGTAYLQRVIVSVPYPSWYWGVFHFGNGGDLIYYRTFLLGRTLSSGLSFFDGKRIHEFQDVKIKMSGKGNPVFKVAGKNGSKRISFTIKSYSKTTWRFRKKYANIIPNQLVYNEYPATVSDLLMVGSNGKRVSLEDLGSSVGNAEYAEGLLL